MKNPFIKELTITDKAVQVARELITTIERTGEIGDVQTTKELWANLEKFCKRQIETL